MTRVRNSKRTARPRRRAGKPKKNVKRPRRTRKSVSSSSGNPVVAYAKLLMDPCHAPLAPAPGLVTPGACLERFRQTYTFAAGGAGSGYIVWFPSFHGDSKTAGAGFFNSSMLMYGNSNPAIPPINTALLPFGFAAEITTGSAVADPVNISLGAGSPFSRATTLSACLQLEWLGALSATQGQVAVVQNYPLSSFCPSTGALGTPPIPPSVNEIFSYAARRERLSVRGHEVVWRPTDEQVKPRTAGDELYGTNSKGPKADTCFWIGETAGASASYLSNPNPSEIYGIAIAFKGVSDSTLIQINAVKTAALELSARNAQIEIPPQPELPQMFNTTVDAVVNAVSQAHPMWQMGERMLANAGIDDASTAIATAGITTLAYSGNTAMNSVGSIIARLTNRRGRLLSS